MCIQREGAIIHEYLSYKNVHTEGGREKEREGGREGDRDLMQKRSQQKIERDRLDAKNVSAKDQFCCLVLRVAFNQ